MFEEGVGRKLGIGASRLKDGGGGEDVEQIALLVIGGCADACPLFAWTLPVVLALVGEEPFPPVRDEDSFPADALVIEVARTSARDPVACMGFRLLHHEA